MINEFKQWTIISQAEVIIPVEYKVLGSVYWERAVFLPEPKTERVGFRVETYFASEVIRHYIEPFIQQLEEGLARPDVDALAAAIRRLASLFNT